MTYTIKIENFSGTETRIALPSKGAVAQFISEYPAKLPLGISVRISCDALGVAGVLRGKASL